VGRSRGPLSTDSSLPCCGRTPADTLRAMADDSPQTARRRETVRPGDRRALVPATVPPAVRFSERRREEIRRRSREGGLERLRKGVYLPPGEATGAADRRRVDLLRRICAAEARLDVDHWFSHTSAAVLHGCWTWKLTSAVHLTQLRPPNHAQAQDTALRRHWTTLPSRDRTTVAGLPATTLERTVVDCARLLSPPQALVVADSALRGGADLARVETILREAAGKRGVVRAREVVALADPRAESPGESILRWIVLDQGLPHPEPGFDVPTRLGRLWVDLAWPEQKVAVEFDGAVKYSGGDYGDPSARVAAEKARQEALEDAGWVVVRVVWSELSDAAGLAERIRRALRKPVRR
jgi:very-short-patch-repair endonuclease